MSYGKWKRKIKKQELLKFKRIREEKKKKLLSFYSKVRKCRGENKLNFDIDDLIKVFSNKGIFNFNYLIHLDSLKSIFTFGILSRKRVNRVGFTTRDISKDIYQQYRQIAFSKFFPDENIYDYVPMYISSHTPMIHPIISPAKKYYAVLKIDIFLLYNLENKLINKVKISNTSINRRNIDSSFRIATLVDILSELDDFLEWDLFNDNTHFLDYKKGQYKSAEILVPKSIAPHYILEVCPKCTELDLKNKYAFSEKIFSKINYENNDFDFINEEYPEIDVTTDETDFDFESFNGYNEEFGEEDELDEWDNKFNNFK
ncbi:hypothetical protein LCGC14_0525680 [marine sediment metagenome]|uniref:DarT domain-containing protein n=1 Tax=marine sediment metagenome TaxID=412755 RepID=A0A0F9RX94_9ZZZZ